MSRQKTTILTRYQQFGSDIRNSRFRDNIIYFHWFGWFISILLFSINAYYAENKNYLLFLLIHGLFLYKLLNIFQKKIRVPTESIFTVLVLLFLGYKHWIVAFNISAIHDPGFFIVFFQIFFLAIITFLFSLFLIIDSGNKRTLVGYGFLAILGHYTLIGGNEYLIFIYQALLFIALLNRTQWLQDLTKAECWIYIVLAFVLFRISVVAYPFPEMTGKQFKFAATGYSFPLILYLFTKIYLLVMLVKIPVVLVYNHAPLSKKLQISGLFQSTFPQLIQLIMMVIMFYAFLSGWQAENLRLSLKKMLAVNQKKAITENTVQYKFFNTDGKVSEIDFTAYDTALNVRRLPRQGILKIATKEVSGHEQFDYFLFSKYSHVDSSFIHFVKIDSTFLSALGGEFRYLAGTSLISYPLSPGEWLDYIYRANFWQNDRYIKLFPFGLKPDDSEQPISVSAIDANQPDKKNQIEIDGIFNGTKGQQLTCGRLFMDIWEIQSGSVSRQKNIYLALDIIYKLEPAFVWSGLPQIMLLLIIIYLLVNFLIIRRVVRFGAEINRMIVQKFNQLKGGISQISSGNLLYKIRMEGDDEFVELADQFNEMGSQLQQSINEAREKERLEYEMQSARQVQLGLLPRELPLISGYEVAASLKTATEVGGDFYDIVRLDAENFLFTIGDVSGKGSSAAFYMAQFMSLIRYSQQFTTEPDELCARLNHYFATEIIDNQIFVTAVVGSLNIKTNKINFVRAGHTEPVFIPDSKSKNIFIPDSSGLGIGLTKSTTTFSKSLKSCQLQMNHGDGILFYTDGVIEATPFDGNNIENDQQDVELYGEQRLRDLIENNRGNTADKMVEILEQDIESFYDGHPRVDDHTILIIKRLPQSIQV